MLDRQPGILDSDKRWARSSCRDLVSHDIAKQRSQAIGLPDMQKGYGAVCLKGHIRLCPNAELKYLNPVRHSCNDYEKVFKRGQELRSHYMTYTGEKPYQCRVCGKIFGSFGEQLFQAQENPL